MALPGPLTLRPMEAEPVDDLPTGAGWLFEPKYDGFRCLAFRDGDRVDRLEAAGMIRDTASARRSAMIKIKPAHRLDIVGRRAATVKIFPENLTPAQTLVGQ